MSDRPACLNCGYDPDEMSRGSTKLIPVADVEAAIRPVLAQLDNQDQFWRAAGNDERASDSGSAAANLRERLAELGL